MKNVFFWAFALSACFSPTYSNSNPADLCKVVKNKHGKGCNVWSGCPFFDLDAEIIKVNRKKPCYKFAFDLGPQRPMTGQEYRDMHGVQIQTTSVPEAVPNPTTPKLHPSTAAGFGKGRARQPTNAPKVPQPAMTSQNTQQLTHTPVSSDISKHGLTFNPTPQTRRPPSKLAFEDLSGQSGPQRSIEPFASIPKVDFRSRKYPAIEKDESDDAQSQHMITFEEPGNGKMSESSNRNVFLTLDKVQSVEGQARSDQKGTSISITIPQNATNEGSTGEDIAWSALGVLSTICSVSYRTFFPRTLFYLNFAYVSFLRWMWNVSNRTKTTRFSLIAFLKIFFSLGLRCRSHPKKVDASDETVHFPHHTSRFPSATRFGRDEQRTFQPVRHCGATRNPQKLTQKWGGRVSWTRLFNPYPWWHQTPGRRNPLLLPGRGNARPSHGEKASEEKSGPKCLLQNLLWRRWRAEKT